MNPILEVAKLGVAVVFTFGALWAPFALADGAGVDGLLAVLGKGELSGVGGRGKRVPFFSFFPPFLLSNVNLFFLFFVTRLATTTAVVLRCHACSYPLQSTRRCSRGRREKRVNLH